MLMKCNMYLTAVIAVMYVMGCVTGHRHFRSNIPNGDRVPTTCANGQMWEGVGHHYPEGGRRGSVDILNRFGVDFKLAGLTWTVELCQKDSDMDGRSNGEELGDPNCTWKRGEVPEHLPSSHPGICEPTDSLTCRQYNQMFGERLDCSRIQEPCSVLSEPGVKREDLRFPVSSIPSSVTTYTCMVFDLPSDADYHLVATNAIINNTDIVHHIVLFGCDFPDDFNGTLLHMMKAAPYRCGMTPHQHCNQFLATWTYGFQGDCASGDSAFRIGPYGTRVSALQIHWNNPRKVSDQTDSSGMTIYYSPSKRKFDASMFVIGQEYINIPPHSTGVTFNSTCSSECTSTMFQEKIFVTRAANHMHYRGTRQRISIYRNGTKVRDLTDDKHYSYDEPLFYQFDPPVEILPGDDIVTECTYSSNSDRAITFGAGTDDEMCYGFLTYYPVQKFLHTVCISWKSIERCKRKLPKFKGLYNGCEWRTFTHDSHTEMTSQAFSNDSCGYHYYHNQCNAKCTDDSQRLLQHPCLQGDFGDWMAMRVKIPINTLRTCAESGSSSNLHRLLYFAKLYIFFCIVYLLIC